MEILFISHKYPPATGGMEKQSFELINGLKPMAKVHSIVYEGEESRLRFFFLLNKRIKQAVKQNPGINVIHFNDGLIAATALIHHGYGQLKRTATLHGLLLPPGHIASWVHSLNQLVAAPLARPLSADRIISFTAQRFNWQKMAEAYLEHFSSLAANPKSVDTAGLL